MSELSVRQIAERAGLHEHVVQQMEDGTRAGDAETIERLVAFMREARDALPEPLPFEDVSPPAATVLYAAASGTGTRG